MRVHRRGDSLGAIADDVPCAQPSTERPVPDGTGVPWGPAVCAESVFFSAAVSVACCHSLIPTRILWPQ